MTKPTIRLRLWPHLWPLNLIFFHLLNPLRGNTRTSRHVAKPQPLTCRSGTRGLITLKIWWTRRAPDDTIQQSINRHSDDWKPRQTRLLQGFRTSTIPNSVSQIRCWDLGRSFSSPVLTQKMQSRSISGQSYANHILTIFMSYHSTDHETWKYATDIAYENKICCAHCKDFE